MTTAWFFRQYGNVPSCTGLCSAIEPRTMRMLPLADRSGRVAPGCSGPVGRTRRSRSSRAPPLERLAPKRLDAKEPRDLGRLGRFVGLGVALQALANALQDDRDRGRTLLAVHELQAIQSCRVVPGKANDAAEQVCTALVDQQDVVDQSRNCRVVGRHSRSRRSARRRRGRCRCLAQATRSDRCALAHGPVTPSMPMSQSASASSGSLTPSAYTRSDRPCSMRVIAVT